jgi:uncharacterized protein YoxC
MPNFDTQTIQLVLVAAVAVILLLQTIFLLVILFTVRKMARSLKEEIEGMRLSITSLIGFTRDLLDRVAPHVESTVTDLAQMAHGLRQQTTDLQTSMREILERLRAQMDRVDSMITSVLDAVDRVSVFVADTLSKPVRQISGLLASVKAIVESLRTSESPRRVRTPDDEGFI